MKKLLLLIIICFSNAQWAKADYGNCIVYEAKFYLKDGTQFNGSIEVAGDGNMSYLNEDGYNEYTSDEGMFELFKKIQNKSFNFQNSIGGTFNPDHFNKVIVFKKIEEVLLSSMVKSNKIRYYNPLYGFVNEGDIVYLDSTDVDKIVFWKAKYVKRDWLTSELVLSPNSMIETIKSKQYWNRLSAFHHPETGQLNFSEQFLDWSIQMINYNPKVNIAELKRLAKLKLKDIYENEEIGNRMIEKYTLDLDDKTEDMKRRIVAECIKRNFQEIREWFWERGILIVQIWGTC